MAFLCSYEKAYMESEEVTEWSCYSSRSESDSDLCRARARLHDHRAGADCLVARVYGVRGKCDRRIPVCGLEQLYHADQRSDVLAGRGLHVEVFGRRDHWPGSGGLLLALLYVFYLRNASPLVRTLVFFPLIMPTVAVAELYSKLFAIYPSMGW